MKPKPVALVSMPSLSAGIPSIQLALLKPTLERAGIPAQSFSLFMYLGSQIGFQLSESLSDVWPNLIGEWVWSKAAFGGEANPEVDAYFDEYREMFTHISKSTGCSLKELRRLRDKVAPQFIDFCAECFSERCR